MNILMTLANPFTHDPRVYNDSKSLSDILPAMNGGASHEEEGWRNAVNVV